MPPKRGQKRKATGTNTNGSNGTNALTPPDRATWTGWVEMESEPAFFNVMLKEMGVRGAKVQEVFSLDENELAFLPQPVHALIFLFRYRTEDEQDQYSGTNQDHIWFANQIPDFACATVALLNIVNNIPGLEMGKELRDFKEFTKDMDPISRGATIDSFEFVKRIHNSFARENDILNADMHTKGKIDKVKKKATAAKARATKEAKKAMPLKEKYANEISKPTTTTGRARKPIRRDSGASSKVLTPKAVWVASAASTPAPDGPDGDFDPNAKGKADSQPNGINGDGVQPRRSGRATKPRKQTLIEEVGESGNEAGFHFVAYIPIDGHVWKLDGLDYYPHDMGSFGAAANGADGGTGNWMHVAAPALMNRMASLQGDGIHFNIMAVVRDRAAKEKSDLLQNIKAIKAVDAKLDSIAEDWRIMEGAETKKDVVTGFSPEFGITYLDIDATELPTDLALSITDEDDFLGLIKLRGKIIDQQRALRSGLRDAMASSKGDEEKARHRRHDYGTFVRSWLRALAEQEVLGDLLG